MIVVKIILFQNKYVKSTKCPKCISLTSVRSQVSNILVTCRPLAPRHMVSKMASFTRNMTEKFNIRQGEIAGAVQAFDITSSSYLSEVNHLMCFHILR